MPAVETAIPKPIRRDIGSIMSSSSDFSGHQRRFANIRWERFRAAQAAQVNEPKWSGKYKDIHDRMRAHLRRCAHCRRYAGSLNEYLLLAKSVRQDLKSGFEWVTPPKRFTEGE